MYAILLVTDKILSSTAKNRSSSPNLPSTSHLSNAPVLCNTILYFPGLHICVTDLRDPFPGHLKPMVRTSTLTRKIFQECIVISKQQRNYCFFYFIKKSLFQERCNFHCTLLPRINLQHLQHIAQKLDFLGCTLLINFTL